MTHTIWLAVFVLRQANSLSSVSSSVYKTFDDHPCPQNRSIVNNDCCPWKTIHSPFNYFLLKNDMMLPWPFAAGFLGLAGCEPASGFFFAAGGAGSSSEKDSQPVS